MPQNFATNEENVSKDTISLGPVSSSSWKVKLKRVCSRVKPIFSCRLRNYFLAIGVVLVALVPIAWWGGNLIALKYFNGQLNQVRQVSLVRLAELRVQVSDTLKRLDIIREMNADQRSCSADIFQREAQLIREWRYTAEAAIELHSGSVCHSFGVAQSNIPLPTSRDPDHYSSGDGRDYWFKAGPGVSADTGAVIIGQNGSYVWLNKGILIDVLNTPSDLSFDLVDDKTLQSHFSNDVMAVSLPKLPGMGVITLSDQRIYFAYPIKWEGTFALISLPIATYYKVWFLSFLSLLVFGLAASLGLYLLGSFAYCRKLSLLNKLTKALRAGELKIHYQPIVDMETGHWKGAEALLRWTFEGRQIPPGVFVPLAESSGLIHDLTRWVCRKVAEDHATYLWACKDLYITINLSAADIADTSFPDFVESVFSEFGVPASRITFEITESALVNKDVAIIQIQRLRELGHRIALDDFGTGYSCLSYLKDLPIDILKIDKSFITSENIRSVDSVFWHITRLAHSLKLIIVVEGVEKLDQVNSLIMAGVPFAQGWFYSKDIPIAQLAKRFFPVKSGI